MDGFLRLGPRQLLEPKEVKHAYRPVCMKRLVLGFVSLLLGGGGIWLSVTGRFEEDIESVPDYDYLQEIMGLESEGRLNEAEHLADWVLNGDNVPAYAEVQDVRDRIRIRRTSFWSRAYRAGRGFVVGDGVSMEELGGAVVSDFLLWGDIRDLVKQGFRKATGRTADPVVAALAAVGVATSVVSYIPDAGEGVEVSADASLSLLKTLRKTGNLSGKFCGVLVEACKSSIKAKEVSSTLKDIFVGIKRLFESAGAARGVAMMKHIDDVDSLTAVSKMSSLAAEPTAILVRTHGAKGVEAVRRIAKSEDGAKALEKSARKGPKALDKFISDAKFAARGAKSFRLEHPQKLAMALIKLIGRVKMAIVSGILMLLGLWRLKALFSRAFRRRKPHDFHFFSCCHL